MNKKQRNALIPLLIGAILWFSPVPDGVTVVAWHLAAVFIATVVGFILQPLPIGAVAFIAITFATLSGLLKVSDALAGYGNSTIWLIVCAFLYSRGFIKSGLGKRIAFGIIKAIGKSALSLGYAIAFSELIISPATPSATARGGGIMYPIVRSLAGALGSEPEKTAKKIGTYLMQVGYHCDAVTCTMFVTSMAGNPLCVALAAKTLGVEVTWMGWASAAIVPGLLSLLLVPLVMLKLTKPELVSIPDAKQLAQKELTAMGPMSRSEKYLTAVFLGSLFFWATSGLTHIGATPVAMAAVCVMIIFDVINWKDVLSEKGAWDAMFWMGSLMTLASALAKSQMDGRLRRRCDFLARPRLGRFGSHPAALLHVHPLLLRQRHGPHQCPLRCVHRCQRRRRCPAAHDGHRLRHFRRRPDFPHALRQRLRPDLLRCRLRHAGRMVEKWFHHDDHHHHHLPDDWCRLVESHRTLVIPVKQSHKTYE